MNETSKKPQLLRGLILLWIALGMLGPSTAFGASEPIDFNADIRPLFSDRCYACHGPDAAARKAGLRLDLSEALEFINRAGEALIQPGAPEKSLLYRRITHTDPDELMPPKESKLSLSAKEKETIRLWIEQGAQWKKHWAFNPLNRVDPPPSQGVEWGRNGIDRFIRKKQVEMGLNPGPEAGKERLIRRLSLDLTGLPPTPEEVEGFLSDGSGAAYERQVDRLLNAQSFGERMALDWMDVARFADTHGYQADRYRPMWPWRDWVINAFNNNLPYDDFIRFQIAGDLLPGATQDQIMATAFNRHHRQTEEGGSVPEEFRVAYVADRVNTMGTAMLGLTLECARCHNHKYDPISQKDYYSLFAFFNNIDESGQTSHFTDSMPVPTLFLTHPEQEKEIKRLRKQIESIEQRSRSVAEKAKEAFQDWVKDLPQEPVIHGEVARFGLDEMVDGKFANAIDPEKPGFPIEDPELIEGRQNKAVLLDGEDGVEFRDVGRFSRVDPFSIGFWVQITKPLDRAVIVHCSKAPLDAANRGYEITLEGGRLTAWLTHMWPGNAVKIGTLEKVSVGKWVHVLMTYDGSSRADGLRLFLDGTLAATEIIRDNLYKDILYERVAVHLTIGQRFRDNGFVGGKVDDLRVFNRELGALEASVMSGKRDWNEWVDEIRKSGADGKVDAHHAGFGYFLRHHHQPWSDHLAVLRESRSGLSERIQPIPEIMVMKEMERPRPAYVLKRGAYDAPGEEVQPSTPREIMPFAEDLPRNRLGLAQWLIDEANPLTARVTVNRYWQMFFGRGLVDTPEDFGSQGSRPTHPLLLDWLAWEFMQSGWDVKGLVKRMVMSATYRQSTVCTEESMRLDPENRYLSRGPSFRLPAELLRDQALAVSGLLVAKVGGPSVKPYQPPGLWEEKSGAVYQMDKGEGQFRRSLYTFWKRTSPPPSMTLFDAPDRETCTVKRQQTNTPLQALAMLNDPQFVQAAGRMALLAFELPEGSVLDKVNWMFGRVLTRSPDSVESSVLNRIYMDQLAYFESNPQAATAFLDEAGIKEDGQDSMEANMLASLAVVATAVLNHEEALVRR